MSLSEIALLFELGAYIVGIIAMAYLCISSIIESGGKVYNEDVGGSHKINFVQEKSNENRKL